jgi:hypothetical protein
MRRMSIAQYCTRQDTEADTDSALLQCWKPHTCGNSRSLLCCASGSSDGASSRQAEPSTGRSRSTGEGPTLWRPASLHVWSTAATRPPARSEFAGKLVSDLCNLTNVYCLSVCGVSATFQGGMTHWQSVASSSPNQARQYRHGNETAEATAMLRTTGDKTRRGRRQQNIGALYMKGESHATGANNGRHAVRGSKAESR